MAQIRTVLLGCCFVVVGGCASTNTGPGVQAQRLDTLRAYATSLYQSHSPEQLAGVKQISYFVTHGVSSHRVPLVDPVVEEGNLPASEGKPPAKFCAVVGLYGLRQTNAACLCEALTFSVDDVRCNTYVLAWDEKRHEWGVLSSVTQP